MKLKKNPEKDLNLKRGIYFVIGLLLILLLTYIAFEWKTSVDNGGYDLGCTLSTYKTSDTTPPPTLPHQLAHCSRSIALLGGKLSWLKLPK